MHYVKSNSFLLILWVVLIKEGGLKDLEMKGKKKDQKKVNDN